MLRLRVRAPPSWWHAVDGVLWCSRAHAVAVRFLGSSPPTCVWRRRTDGRNLDCREANRALEQTERRFSSV